MGLKVFVTTELFPFTAGGIGRVVANMLQTTPSEQRDQMAVLYVGEGVDSAAFAVAYPGVKFLAWPQSFFKPVDSRGRYLPPRDAFTHGHLHWQSTHVAQGLEEMCERFGALEYVEFIDWGAAAFAAAQLKKLGQSFCSTTLAVRLHTTDSILADFEPRPQDTAALNLFDLERKALADCDLIVGQVPPVAEAFRRFYGFDESEWQPRLRIHAPPVLLDTLPPSAKAHRVDDDTPILFTSKLQDIKRPDVFIRGCVQFMRARPAYRGSVIFLAHSFDPHYQAYVTGLVPEDLRDRVVFAKGVQGAAREQQISRSVAVFPSPWESFCLAAYEASISGAVCVMNSANPAFGPDSPWIDGVNCLTFDASAEKLAEALVRLYEKGSESLIPAAVPENVQPWTSLPQQLMADATVASLSVVVTNDNDGTGLLQTLDSILSSGAIVHQIIVVDNASSDPRDVRVLEQLPVGEQLVLKRTAAPAVDAVTRNLGLESVETELVAFIRSGDRFAPHFLGEAANALSRQPRFDIVVGQSLFTSAEGNMVLAQPGSDWRIYYGEARLAGMYENRFAPDAFVVRTSVLKRYRFDDVMPVMEVWEVLMRMVFQGSRVLVDPALAVLAARRTAHSRLGTAAEVALRAARHRMQRKRVSVGKLDVPAYFISRQGGGDVAWVGGGQDDASAKLQELMEAESVRYTLALAALLHRRAPWMLRSGKWLARRLAPLYRRLR